VILASNQHPEQLQGAHACPTLLNDYGYLICSVSLLIKHIF